MNNKTTLILEQDEKIYYIRLRNNTFIAAMDPSQLILGISYFDFANVLLKNTTLYTHPGFSLGYFTFSLGYFTFSLDRELGWSGQIIPNNFTLLQNEFNRLKELEFYN